MKETILKTKNLIKTYEGINRVENLNLEIKKGEIYGFLGPNGAGKSTTMKMITGLILPTEGEMEIFSVPFSNKTRPEILKQTGSIIENPSYYGHLTALENMQLIQKLLDLEETSIIVPLKLVGLWKDRNRKVEDFSLGMKQRLAIAMALIKDPKLLILDEPMNGLDPSGTQEIRELLRSLAKEKGITIMISSHLLTEIEKLADHIGIINDGKLIFQDTIDNLKKLLGQKTILHTNDNERAAAILKNYQPKFDGQKLMIHNLNLQDRAQINKELVHNGLAVDELSIQEESLEDIFLRLTESSKLND